MKTQRTSRLPPFATQVIGSLPRPKVVRDLLDARFLAEHTDRLTKFALPSPFLIAVRYWHEDYSRDPYPTWQHFMDHLAELLAREAQAVVDAGSTWCRSLWLSCCTREEPAKYGRPRIRLECMHGRF